ncbi:hypothetical protein K8I61_06380 [bacterium]|nr:hypothetical protein [bacterium]
MPLPVGQVQSVLSSYMKQLRTRGTSEKSGGGSRGPDVVTISLEGKRRELMERIGDAAVRAFRESAGGKTQPE